MNGKDKSTIKIKMKNEERSQWHGNESQLPKVHTTTYGIETISFLGNRLWSTLPNIFKQASTHPIFKTILNVGRARAATADFAKYIYHRLGTYYDMNQSLFLNGCNIFSLEF